MAKLSRKEAEMLERLKEKSEAPDTAPSSRTLNVTIDLGDEAQVKRAQKLGLLDGLDDDDDDEAGDDDDESDGEEVPRRRGYFDRS